MSDLNGMGEQQIGNLQQQQQIFEVKQEQIEENLNQNKLADNTQISTTKQQDPVMKHTEIPVYQAAQLDMQKLSLAQITEKHSDWMEKQKLQKKSNDFSLNDLNNMDFEQLAVWATRHAREKGDDRGEFGPIGSAMTDLLSITKAIENESLTNLLKINVDSAYNEAAGALNAAVEKYKGSHSPKPWFKKGKLRARFCQILSADMVQKTKDELSAKATNIYNDRISEANQIIKEKSGLDINNSKALALVEVHLDRMKNLRGEDGKPISENPKTAKVLNNRVDKLMARAHYNLNGAEGEKIIEKLKKNGASSSDIDRNVALKDIKFDADGNMLPEYKENDKWNLAYIKALEDGSYEAMKPFLEDMYNEMMDSDFSEWVDTEKYLNTDYLANNIDKVMRKMDLALRFQGNILKNNEYKKFNDEMKNNGLFDAFDKLTLFFANYSGGAFEYYHMKELGMTTVEHRLAQEAKQFEPMIDSFVEMSKMEFQGLIDDGVMKTIKDFQNSEKRFRGYQG